MSVRLRLSPHRRLPSSQQIYYRIVAINAPRARDSKPLDTIGAYDPVPQHLPVVPASERSLLDEGKEPEMRWIKRVEWDREKVGYWISVGAQPSRRVAWLLQKVCGVQLLKSVWLLTCCALSHSPGQAECVVSLWKIID